MSTLSISILCEIGSCHERLVGFVSEKHCIRAEKAFSIKSHGLNSYTIAIPFLQHKIHLISV